MVAAEDCPFAKRPEFDDKHSAEQLLAGLRNHDNGPESFHERARDGAPNISNSPDNRE